MFYFSDIFTGDRESAFHPRQNHMDPIKDRRVTVCQSMFYLGDISGVERLIKVMFSKTNLAFKAESWPINSFINNDLN